MGDLTSEPEIGSYITDQREPVDTTDVECVFICPSDLMVIIEIDIRNVFTQTGYIRFTTDKIISGAANLGHGHG